MTKTPKIQKTEFKALDRLIEDLLKERDWFRKMYFDSQLNNLRKDRIISDLNIEIGRLMGKGDSHE